jgi:hypothetical protein
VAYLLVSTLFSILFSFRKTTPTLSSLPKSTS